jgi:type I restriction enzyme S subunit
MSQMHTKLAATLPEGWKLQPLAQVAQVIDCKHRTPVYTDEGYPVVRPRDVRETGICFEQCLRTSHEEYKDLTEKRQPQPGDIVYSRNATFGVASLVDTQASFAIGQDVCLIVPENVDSRYLYRLLNAPFVKQQLGLVISGSTFKRINLLEIRKLQILLPRLEEQRRIAAILDKADAVRRKRKEAIALTEELLRSAFLEMFGDPVTNPKGWDRDYLGNHILHANNGLSRRRKTSQNEGEIVLRLQDVKAGYISFDEPNRIALDEDEKKRYLLEPNDLVFIRVNGNKEYVGRCAVYKGFDESVYHNDHIIRIQTVHKISSDYLAFVLNHSSGKKILRSQIKTSAGQYTISQKGIESLQLPIPQREIQDEFIRRSGLIEGAKRRHQNSLIESQTLFNSLLQRAFRGEL